MKIQNLKEGCRFWVKVTPKAFKNECLGWEGEYLKIKIKASPTKGDANEALIKFLADLLQIPKSKINLDKGQASRFKQITVQSISASDIEKKLVVNGLD